MLQPENHAQTSELPTLREIEQMRRDLAEAQAHNRSLRRELDKAVAAAQEAQRAHAKMVATLTETMRENTSLTHERDMWRARAQRSESGEGEPGGFSTPIDISGLAGRISDEEINAIRKAMARLHHPDVGGNPERMKSWNAALDRLLREG